MVGFLYRYGYVDLWVPLWPNLLAGLIAVITGVAFRNPLIRAAVPVFHKHYVRHVESLNDSGSEIRDHHNPAVSAVNSVSGSDRSSHP